MKVTLINGSPRRDGNTFTALALMAGEFKEQGIDAEIVHAGSEKIHGCIACGYCFKSEGNLCVMKDDIVNDVMLKMRASEGIVLGTPVYYAGIAGGMKSFLDRVFYASAAGKNFRHKIGATVAVVRRAGGTEVHSQLRNYLDLSEMICAPSQYWVIGYGAQKGEVMQDEEGVQTIRRNARGMAWLLKTLKESKVPPPEDKEPKARTNFIR